MSLIFSISGALIFGGLLLFDFIVSCLRHQRREVLRISPLTISLVAYFVWGIVVSVSHHSLQFFDVLNIQTSLLLVYLFSHGLSESELKTFLKWLAISSVVMAAWGLFQVTFGGSYEGMDGYVSRYPWQSFVSERYLQYVSTMGGRPLGTRSHPLTYAETLLPGYFFFLNIIVYSWKKPFANGKIFFSFLMMGLAIILCQSRGVWLAVMIGTLVLGFFKSRRLAIQLLLAIFLVNAVACVVSPMVRHRLFSIFSSSQGSGGDQLSKQIRYQLWQQSLTSARKHPYTGVGLKGARFNVNDTNNMPREWSESHNMYLQALVDQGGIGLVLLLWVLLTIFIAILKLPAEFKSGAMGLYGAFLVAGLTESWLGDREIALLFWTFVGCVVMMQQNRNIRHEEI